MNQYYPAALVRLQGELFDAVQQPTAAGSVTLTWGPRGSGSPTVITSGFTNPVYGTYTYDVDLTSAAEGVYDYWWETNGGAQASNVGSFQVLPAPF
jgi:hypothetical protein